MTDIVTTILDLAAVLSDTRLERAVNEADKLYLIEPGALRAALETHAGTAGVARLRDLLDLRSFRLTDSDLESRFLALVPGTGLPMPMTGRRVNGFDVDFFWPDLGLIVETDGLRYHRTPSQQSSDRRRDQAHTAAGMTALRFTHSQVRFEPEEVINTLIAVGRRLGSHSRAQTASSTGVPW